MAGLSCMGLPLITEATNDYYRNIYADPHLGPIFKGVNMVVLRTHVSFFIHQLTMFDSPMTLRQLEYLHRVHEPIIAKHGITQRHYDIMLQYLTDAMRTNGAEEYQLQSVQAKLLPLRSLFPLAQQSEDGRVLVKEQVDVDAAGHDTNDKGGTETALGSSTSTYRSSSRKPAWVQRVVRHLKALKQCTTGQETP